MIEENAEFGQVFDDSKDISNPDELDYKGETEDTSMSDDLLGPPAQDSDDDDADDSASAEPVAAEPAHAGKSPRTQGRSAPVAQMDRATAARLFRENREARQSAASDILKFATAARTKNVLEGTIAGVITDGTEVCWTIYHSNITVRIPYAESYMTLEDSLLANKRPVVLERQRQMMTKSIGATVPYVIESFVKDPGDENSYIAYASRREALSRHRKVRYFGSSATRRVEVGSNVTAQIISIGPNAAWVCTCGMDVRVPNFLLSHRYIDDVSRYFTVGQELTMRVMRLEKNPADEFTPKMSLSARPVEIAKFRPNLRRIVGDHARFGGSVTSLRVIDDSRGPRVIVNLFLDGIEVPAFTSTGHLHIRDDLKSGDRVLFEAHGKTESGYAYGNIIRYIHEGRRR